MKIPKAIIVKLDPEVQSLVEAAGKSATYLSKLHLLDDNIKDRTRRILWEIYDKEGYNRFLEVAKNFNSIKGKEFNDMIQVKGEVAEVVLEVLITQFCISNQIRNWYLYKGLILGNKKDANFSTELDIVLLTAGVASIIEIKSYNGDKVITGDCFITATNGTRVLKKDVYSQNKLHIQAFWDNFSSHAKSDIGIIKSVLFSFARGTLTDNRTIQQKSVMPAYNEETFPSYLMAVNSLKREPRWELNSLVRSIEKTLENSISIEQHISYVNSLHGKT